MPTPLPSRVGRVGAALLALLALPLLPACTSASGCTEIGCNSEAIVTFSPNLVSGSYDLVIEGDEAMATARCSDPSAPETADNPEGLTCNGQGFTLDGHPLADEREVTVTVIPSDGSDPVEGLVRLEAIEERTPNGPDCPPICVVRNGLLSTPEV